LVHVLVAGGGGLSLWCGGAPGTIGHVAHGKSTVVKAISGVQV
jgi:ABC-type protease/lipase transport system fused ATPase/permease subunit